MDKPYHILTLSTLFPNAEKPNFGIFVERQTAGLANRDDFDVTVINPIGIAPWPLSHLKQYRGLLALPKHENWRGLNIYRPRFPILPAIGGALNPIYIANAILPLVKKLHSQNPFDAIDAEFFYPDGPAAMRIARVLNLPFSIKSRGADIHHWPTQRGCKKQIMQAADEADGLLAVSEALKRDMSDLGMDENKITVHYTGMDHSRFHPHDRVIEKAKLNVAGPLIICVAALIERKNQNLIIEALQQVPNATLMLAGTGPAQSGFEQLAKDLGLENNVRFLGAVPHDELPSIIAAADVSCLVSESEGLANAWVESLACGTPIVISDVGGARELVRDDISGYITERNADDIAASINTLLATPRNPEKVAQSVAHFSWDKNAETMDAHLRKIIEK